MIFSPSRKLQNGLAAFRQAEREQLQLFADIRQAAAHQPLHRIHGSLRMRDQHLAAPRARDDFTRFRRRNHAGYDAGKNARPGQLHHRDQAVGGAQVDAYDFRFRRSPKSI